MSWLLCVDPIADPMGSRLHAGMPVACARTTLVLSHGQSAILWTMLIKQQAAVDVSSSFHLSALARMRRLSFGHQARFKSLAEGVAVEVLADEDEPVDARRVAPWREGLASEEHMHTLVDISLLAPRHGQHT